MKKLLALFATAFITNLALFGQAPGIFNYQGVARNSVGNVLQNQAISLRLSIRDLTATGTIVYSETRAITTNPFGLFNVQVGSTGATNVTGTIAGVNWNVGAKFIQVEIDPNGGATFINIGTAQLASVPYALNAASSGAIALPFVVTQPDAGPLFRLTNSGAGEAINGISTGTGRGGYFQVNNAASTADALRAETNGTGASWAFRGISTGTNGAGLFVQSNPTNTSNNLQSNQGGLGRAGLFNSTNAASTANAVDINVAGTGYALQAASTNAVPRALRTVGAIQFTGLGEAAGRVLTTDAAGNATWAPSGAGTLTLPFVANENSAVTLFSINNAGDGVSIEGTNSTTTSSIAAIRGIVNNTAPGGFSAAVRGMNNGTGGLGIGIWGSQGGSGWGVYGVTPNGLGVYGNSTAAGYGVFGNSTSGTGVYGTSTDGTPGNFVVTNNTNNNAALSASTLSDGVAIEGTSSSTTSSVAAIRGIISATAPGGFSSAVRGLNNGTGGLGVGVWGSQAGSGWGVYGSTPDGLGVYGNANAGGIGVFANSNTGTGIQGTSNNGVAANFTISNNANNNNVINASSLGGGTIVNVSTTGSGKGVFSSTGAGFAIHGVTTSISSAGIIGDNNGGGEAVVGRNTSDIAGAVVGRNDGGGYGVRGFIGSNASGTAIGVLGQIGIGGSTGRAGRFENTNATNIQGNTFEVETNGNGNIPDNTQGNAASFLVDNTNSVAAGVRSEVKTIFGNFGAAGIFGVSSGTGGFAGLFHASNPAGNGPALVAIADGNGNAITANAANGGDGVETTVDGTGNALYAWTPTFSTGSAARLVNFNDANVNSVLTVETHSAGNIAVFKAGDPATVNVARIDATGRGFFNNGTQNSGADIAEAFDVEGNTKDYEAGDILVISTGKDRAVEKSSTPYSTLVAGVYATKPGVLLTEEHIDSKLEGKVPMGVVGVIPTKVCPEGGAIKRGDMLVTSSIPGVAMKADPDKVKIGQVLGKALQDYNATTVGKINVLVNVK